MKYPSLEYDLLVRTLMAEHEAKMHKVTQMTEEETAREIANIQDGAVSSFEPHPNAWKGQAPVGSMEIPTTQVPRKRGRPKGSKNRPKVNP